MTRERRRRARQGFSRLLKKPLCCHPECSEGSVFFRSLLEKPLKPRAVREEQLGIALSKALSGGRGALV